MRRILWMVLMNWWYVPFGLYRLLRISSHPERYSLEERFAVVKEIDNRAIRGGRVVIDGHGMENLPEKDGYILFPNHQGMFDVLAIIQLLKNPTSVVLKKELANIPFLKQVFACLDAIPLDRSDVRQGMQVILQVVEEVKRDETLLFFRKVREVRWATACSNLRAAALRARRKQSAP